MWVRDEEEPELLNGVRDRKLNLIWDLIQRLPGKLPHTQVGMCSSPGLLIGVSTLSFPDTEWPCPPALHKPGCVQHLSSLQIPLEQLKIYLLFLVKYSFCRLHTLAGNLLKSNFSTFLPL